MRDDPLPLASAAVELMQRAARLGVAKDQELEAILTEFAAVLPILRADEPRTIEWMTFEVKHTVKPSAQQ